MWNPNIPSWDFENNSSWKDNLSIKKLILTWTLVAAISSNSSFAADKQLISSETQWELNNFRPTITETISKTEEIDYKKQIPLSYTKEQFETIVNKDIKVILEDKSKINSKAELIKYFKEIINNPTKNYSVGFIKNPNIGFEVYNSIFEEVKSTIDTSKFETLSIQKSLIDSKYISINKINKEPEKWPEKIFNTKTEINKWLWLTWKKDKNWFPISSTHPLVPNQSIVTKINFEEWFEMPYGYYSMENNSGNIVIKRFSDIPWKTMDQQTTEWAMKWWDSPNIIVIDWVSYERSGSQMLMNSFKDKYSADVDKILAELKVKEKTKEEKINTIYNWIIENISYDYDSAISNWWLWWYWINALYTKKWTCSWYSELMIYMLKKCWVSASVYSLPNIAHAIVVIDWKYYDPTWEAGKQYDTKTKTYNYYSLTKEQMLKDHNFSWSFLVGEPVYLK